MYLPSCDFPATLAFVNNSVRPGTTRGCPQMSRFRESLKSPFHAVSAALPTFSLEFALHHLVSTFSSDLCNFAHLANAGRRSSPSSKDGSSRVANNPRTPSSCEPRSRCSRAARERAIWEASRSVRFTTLHPVRGLSGRDVQAEFSLLLGWPPVRCKHALDQILDH